MTMTRELLIIDPRHEFGTLTDVVKWCEYLRYDYRITVLSFDGPARYEMPGVRVVRIGGSISSVCGKLAFILAAMRLIHEAKGVVWMEYFRKCHLFKSIFPGKRWHVDVRSLCISTDESYRKAYDRTMVAECARFRSISTLSEGVAARFGRGDVKMLPLGADVISGRHKCYTDGLRLLYVGTFDNRNLHLTVQGIAMFVRRHPEISVTYDLIGTGCDEAVAAVENAIRESSLDCVVTLHGYVSHDRLAKYFDNANIGVAFVPLTEYFDAQPPTKTYEYLMSGLYTVATSTSENRKLITPESGTLIDDTPEGFCRGLEKFCAVSGKLSFNRISSCQEDASWRNIVDRHLIPILSGLS